VTPRSQPEHILQTLIDASRLQPAPVVDYEQLQSSVRRALISQTFAETRPLLRRRWMSAVAVAVSFFIGGWYMHAQHPTSERVNAEKPLSVQPLDGRVLILGQELEAGREPLVVNHPGVAKWTLAPGGRARLAAKGTYLTIHLDQGHLDADVIPSSQLESFAVETGALRVAVHGTSFSVSRENGSVEVAVTAGTVVVGSLAMPGHTEGTVLHAPERRMFSADSAPLLEPAPVRGRTASESGLVPRSKALASPSARSASAVYESDRPEPAASAEVSLPDHPSRVEVESALDTVRAATARCFADAKGGDPSRDSRVMVRVDTELTVTLSPSGIISGAVFDPPIPNSIWECTRRESAAFVTSASKLGATTSRPIMLTR